jgi:hypothetical protein
MDKVIQLTEISSIIPLDQIDFASVYAQIILKQSDLLLCYYDEITAIDRTAPKFKISLQKAKLVLFQSTDDIRQYLLYLIANQHIESSQASQILKAYHQYHDFNDLLLFQDFLLLNQMIDPYVLNQMLIQFTQKQFLDVFSIETGVLLVKEFKPSSDLVKVPTACVRLLIQGIQKNYSKSKLYSLRCTFESVVSKSDFSVWESDLYPSEKTLLSLAKHKTIAELVDGSHLEPRFALSLSYALLLLGELYFDQEIESTQIHIESIPPSISTEHSSFTINPISKPLEYTINPISQSFTTSPLPIRLKQVADMNNQLLSQDAKKNKEINDLKLISQIAISENYFKILNVPYQCQVEQVHKHWLFLKQKLEKYLNRENSNLPFSRDELKNIASIIDDAYRVLSDQRLKEIYINAIQANS